MKPYEVNIAQVDAEIEGLSDILFRENVRSFLEIGSKFGGSLWRLAKVLPAGSRIVSVDMPNGTKAWNESSASLKTCIADLTALGYDARVIWGSSTNAAVIDQVRALGPFDAILIDANHTMPFVKADWQNYGPMGRIVAFHDIAWKRAPEWIGTRIDVPQFWDSIRGAHKHVEFKFCPTGKNNGIGVLWR